MPDDAVAVDTADVDTISDSVEGNGSEEKTTQDEPKPGTPDKALQKVQQELGNVTRELALLKEKKGELSEADKARMAKVQQRVDTIRSKAQDFGIAVDGGTELAEHVLDLTEKVGKQEQSTAELRELRERLALLENDRSWAIVKEKYAGLDVNAIWDKALTDANDVLGEEATPRARQRLASKWFEERCDAAKKRHEPEKKEKGSAPSQYKVGTGQKAAPTLSDDEELIATARSLIVED